MEDHSGGSRLKMVGRNIGMGNAFEYAQMSIVLNSLWMNGVTNILRLIQVNSGMVCSELSLVHLNALRCLPTKLNNGIVLHLSFFG